jgi:uracil-DNA glycosylase family 4
VTEAERREALDQVAAEVRACTRCRLHEGRSQAVPGEGHPSTEVLLVGEGPGLNEDRQGRPFVGAAGGFLSELLETVGWSRDEVFITNVVKCRPPQNRDPEPDEIAACAPYLRRQVEILDPALVITLGRHSMGRFMPGARIGQVHGTTAPAPAVTGAREALVFAMYHPAAALHQASLRQTLLDDMTGAPRALSEARRLRDARQASAATASAEEHDPTTERATAAEPEVAAVEPAQPEPPAAPEPEAAAAEPAQPEPAQPEPRGAAEPAAVPWPDAMPVPLVAGRLPPALDPGLDATDDQMTLF